MFDIEETKRIRACYHCIYSQVNDETADLECASPEIIKQSGATIHVQKARLQGMACGPDANCFVQGDSGTPKESAPVRATIGARPKAQYRDIRSAQANDKDD